MAILYVIDGTDMQQHDMPADDLENAFEASSGDLPVVLVFTHAEFDDSVAAKLDHPIVMQTMARTLACHADIFDTCTAGVISIPDKEKLLERPHPTGFYVDRHRLILVDDTDESTSALAALASTRRRSPLSPARVLFFLLENLILDDAVFLEDFEARLGTTEESIIDMDRVQANRAITSIRRELLRLDYYYEQLEDIGELLEENANELFDDSDARTFGVFSRHANRLFDRTRTLKEYSLQLHELQQTQLDVKQNETMRWLTVVTSIFVPLTLVTSWYGMNFKDMPELDWQWGYVVVIIVCLVIVTIELLYLKRKKWL